MIVCHMNKWKKKIVFWKNIFKILNIFKKKKKKTKEKQIEKFVCMYVNLYVILKKNLFY